MTIYNIELRFIHYYIMANIRQLIYESVKSAIDEKRKQERLVRLVSEEVMSRLNEKDESTETKEKENKAFYNDKLTNGAELARETLPDNWKDSTKRSYMSKLLSKDNKNSREASEKETNKINNKIK